MGISAIAYFPRFPGEASGKRRNPGRLTERAGVAPLAFSSVARYHSSMLRPAEFVEPCLPTISRTVPSGAGWAYEIKHDGFRFRRRARYGGCRNC